MHESPADSTPDEVDQALSRAQLAFRELRRIDDAARARLLEAMADELGADADRLLDIAVPETGLGRERLAGELFQAQTDLRMLATWIAGSRHRDIVLDPADPQYTLGPKPELRRARIPAGVVLNFAASNFPFAFSVPGVDTASALAAGCAVVVKAHPGHPRTSAATADALARAAATVPELSVSPVQLIHGADAGLQALRDPRVKVACFTGSLSGGRFLAGVAASRPDPIPFYGELGSINPVVIAPGALAQRRDALAEEFVAEFAFSAGQVCVKPGLLLAPAGHGMDERISRAAAATPDHRLLYPSLGDAYAARRDELMALPGVRVLAAGAVRRDADGHVWATPTVLSVSLEDARSAASVIAEEAFGPLSIVVEYTDAEQAIAALPEWIPGSLTASVHVADEDADLADAIGELQHIAGRVSINQWPGAVYITPGQHHGGPWPATTLDTLSATSVGQYSLGRFQRTVSWQNAPEAFLPPELRSPAG